MASRFMKIKKIILPVMATIILVSQLSGCAVVSSNEMLDMLNEGQDIEISIAMPDYPIDIKGEQAELTRIQLDSLKTYMENGFRDDFDKLFGIKAFTNEDGTASKQGCIYINSNNQHDGNTSFMDSLRNQKFMEKLAASEDALGSLGEVVYADVDADSYDAVLAALNAYYDIFSEGEKGTDDYFNAAQSITRGEFYSFMYRATAGVNTDLTVQGDFESQVGVSASEDENVVYASQVDQFAWLNRQSVRRERCPPR